MKYTPQNLIMTEVIMINTIVFLFDADKKLRSRGWGCSTPTWAGAVQHDNLGPIRATAMSSI